MYAEESRNTYNRGRLGYRPSGARMFAHDGDLVVVIDICDSAHETLEIIEKEGGQAAAVIPHIRSTVDVDQMAADVLAKVGYVDVRVDNVAVVRGGDPLHCDEEMWDEDLPYASRASTSAVRLSLHGDPAGSISSSVVSSRLAGKGGGR